MLLSWLRLCRNVCLKFRITSQVRPCQRMVLATQRDLRFNRRMKIKNKWEVALVLIVIAAGIIITTIAAIKAKEKRQMSENKNALKASHNKNHKPGEVKEIITSQSVDKSKFVTFPSKRKQLINSNKKKNNENNNNDNNNNERMLTIDHATPDYDVEYDDIKSLSDEYMASETLTNHKSNRISPKHDGLPGFPPPKGLSLYDYNTNTKAELTAHSAGFSLDSMTQTNTLPMSQSTNKKQLEIIPNPAKVNLPHSSVIHNNNNNNNNNHGDDGDNFDDDQVKTNFQHIFVQPSPQQPSSVKFELKKIPVFIDPNWDIQSQHNNGYVNNKKVVTNQKLITTENHNQNQNPVHIIMQLKNPSKNTSPYKSSITYNGIKEHNNNVNNNNVNNNRQNFESAIRFLGLSDEIAHPLDYAQSLPNLSKMPLNLKTILTQSSSRKKRSLDDDDEDYLLLEKNNNTNEQDHEKKNKTLNELDVASQSRYFSFADHNPFRRENIDDESDNEDDKDPDNLSQLFNFDDPRTKRFPTRQNTKSHDQNYYPSENRKHQKYGILGSGNFEIIRGGIYSDDESASNNVPNYISGNNNNNREFKSDKSKSHYDDQRDNNQHDDDNESNSFDSYNDDFFSNNPVLGFQGYDNFGSSNDNNYKGNTNNNQRRHDIHDDHLISHYPHHHHHSSAATNLISISTNQDLEADS